MWGSVLLLLSKIPGSVLTLVTGIDYNAIFRFLKANWKLVLSVIVVALLLFTSWGWDHDHKLLVQERVSHATDIRNFKQAQEEATAKAVQIRANLLKEAKANAAQADASYSNLLAKYHASILRFKVNQSAAGGPSNSEFPTAESGNGAGTSSRVPETIVITLGDAQVCAINTARLQAVHDWATNLMKNVP